MLEHAKFVSGKWWAHEWRAGKLRVSLYREPENIGLGVSFFPTTNSLAFNFWWYHFVIDVSRFRKQKGTVIDLETAIEENP